MTTERRLYYYLLSYFLFQLFVLIQNVEPKNQDAAKACASTGLVDIACLVAEFMTCVIDVANSATQLLVLKPSRWCCVGFVASFVLT